MAVLAMLVAFTVIRVLQPGDSQLVVGVAARAPRPHFLAWPIAALSLARRHWLMVALALAFVLVLVTLMVTAPSSTPIPAGSQYFVDCRAGSDTADGSATAPWKSLARVSSKTFVDGSVIRLARGCSWQGPLTVKGTGTAAAGISVTAYGVGNAPSISDVSTYYGGAVDLAGPYITLSSVAITAAREYGVRALGRHDSIVSVDISNVGGGVLAKAAYMVANHVAVHDLHMIVNTPGGKDDHGAVGFDIHAANATVENSSCTNCIAASYDFGQDGGFVEIYDSSDNLYVYNNVATNTQGFIEAGASTSTATADNVTILHNTMNNVHGGFCIHSGTTDVFAISTSNVVVSGNTITNSSSTPIFGCYLGSMDFENNVVTTNGAIAGTAPYKHHNNRYVLGNHSRVGFSLDPSETAVLSQLPVA